MHPNKKRRLESGGCEEISQQDLDARQIFSQIRNSFQQGTLSLQDIDTFENKLQLILSQHKSQIKDLKQEVSSLRKRTSVPATEQKETERTVSEFANEKAIASMTKMPFSAPKGKMFIEFFPSYMTVRPQARYDSCEPAVIAYDDIQTIIAVPTKHKTSSITVLIMKCKVPLCYQKAKRSSAAFGITFDSSTDPEDYQLEINVQNLAGKAQIEPILRGSREIIFNELIAKLAGLSIERHDQAVFKSNTEKSQFFVSCAMGPNQASLYPLRCGLFFTKPLLFVPISNIESFHSGRETSSGLRFFDFDIVRKKTKEKQKKKESFSMISVAESPALMQYFNTLRVPNTAVVQQRRQAEQEKKSANDTMENDEEVVNDDADDSMSSDDSDFDLDEELEKVVRQRKKRAQNDSDEDADSQDEQSEDDVIDDMRALAVKQRERRSSRKKGSKNNDISDEAKPNEKKKKKKIVLDSGSSTESDAEMNEPLFGNFSNHVDLTADTSTSGDVSKENSDVEMTEPNENESGNKSSNPSNDAPEPKKKTRRWRRVSRKTEEQKNREGKPKNAITRFFATSK